MNFSLPALTPTPPLARWGKETFAECVDSSA